MIISNACLFFPAFPAMCNYYCYMYIIIILLLSSVLLVFFFLQKAQQRLKDSVSPHLGTVLPFVAAPRGVTPSAAFPAMCNYNNYMYINVTLLLWSLMLVFSSEGLAADKRLWQSPPGHCAPLCGSSTRCDTPCGLPCPAANVASLAGGPLCDCIILQRVAPCLRLEVRLEPLHELHVVQRPRLDQLVHIHGLCRQAL
jgi:hypothetical protein